MGAVRDVLYNGVRRRQKLLAMSDTERSQTYGFASEPPLHTLNFQATLRVTPVVDGDHAFVGRSIAILPPQRAHGLFPRCLCRVAGVAAAASGAPGQGRVIGHSGDAHWLSTSWPDLFRPSTSLV